MAEEKQSKPIYTCPECQGLGEVAGNACRNCGGVGVALFLNGEVFCFDHKLNSFSINSERYARRTRSLINTLFLLFGVAGLGFIFYVIFSLTQHGANWFPVVYLRNEYTFIFWVSLLTDFYLVYRINRESKPRSTLKPRSFWRRNSDTATGGSFGWNFIKKYKKREIFNSFDQRSKQAVEEAWLLADKLKHGSLHGLHLLISFLSNTQANLVLARLSVDHQRLIEKVKHGLQMIAESGKRTTVSFEVKQALLEAYLIAYEKNKKKVNATDILIALTRQVGLVREILYDLVITDREIEHASAWVDLQSYLILRWHKFRYLSRLKPKSAMNRAYTAVATPRLDNISRDMTLWARAGAYAPCIGREKEIAEIFRILEVDKIGALLVGYPGVGKGSILEGIAELMVKEEVPQILQDKRLVSLSVSGLIAGAGQFGAMEEKMVAIMREIARARNIVLVIEDIQHLVGVATTGGESMDLAEVLAEQAQAHNFLVIATTTPEMSKEKIEKTNLSKVLQKVLINEADQDEAIRVLEAKALQFEAEHKIYFSYQAIETTVRMAGQYLRDTYLPEKAVKLLEQVAISVKNKNGEKTVVKAEDVAEAVADLTNIPVTKITADESKKLLNLEQVMHERVVGQNEAISMVASAIRRARTELRGKSRPIAAFLFLGSTGVGKTEVAKTLAAAYFNSEKDMVRLDMSEYQASDALAKLIGDAQTGKGGFLTEKVRKNPFTLILLDELEKASSDILNLFLQVFDDGRLTDATGKTIDFTNAIIIGTSNAGTEFIQESLKLGKGMAVIQETLLSDHLKKYFRPELLNRFDGIVVFAPLNMEDVAEIARIFLRQLAERLEEKGIEFGFEEVAVLELARLGYDPTMGARPLRRVVQDKIEDALAKLFLENKLERRDRVILQKGLVLAVVKAQEL
ncbi:hypothetical protein A3C68_01405 [Candidatus Kuenenbacteria bacterium RIFCSPHIGHO2_02_FULL_42_29]|uniref:Clp R domain-containing protein n=1 Tax=Candidatus Kuenenbacteria bacterium RIFCSPLOWO2_02_FULL_42_16 TaxID=1798564 RepID=A0A1F6FWK1_9BACT|nr:MAG: hypothetical protein A3C68_01405 [Candidatus Kuenenbacteria bacterium RIFCSPHIGHO2_02_FULL_42_29]OGG90218.1 MAG: hypothetical protein A3H55_01850 [Candidatus Kuenenbacteria bacterium RIFCSPLOWO2_02_FULL_42_16]